MADRLVPEGTYTIIGSDGHGVTIDIADGEWACKPYGNRPGQPTGTKVAQLLIGPNNSRDFQGFAFIAPDGRITPWKAAADRPMRALRALLTSKDPQEYGFTYALQSSRCFRCGRKLTVEASIHRGLGPDCAEVVGEWFEQKRAGGDDLPTIPVRIVEPETVALAPAPARNGHERGSGTVSEPERDDTLTFDVATMKLTARFKWGCNGFDDKKARVKSLGARWDGDAKVWTIRVEPANASRIADALRTFVSFGDVADQLAALDSNASSNLAASKSASAAFVPRGVKEGMALRPFQAAGVKYITESGGGICADEMGLGKTPQSLAAIAHLGCKRALIIVPASLKLNWKREAERWVAGARILVVGGGRVTAGMLEWASIVIINYENIDTEKHPWLVGVAWDAIVCDEAHYLKNPKAQRTANAQKIVDAANPEILKLRLMLTGTPVLNRPIELYPLLKLTGREDAVGGFFPFVKRYCNPVEAPIWMGDFTFKPIGDVRVGDEIVGWQREPGVKRDTLKRARVTAVHRHEAEVIRVTMESGSVIRCTPDHRWFSPHGNPDYPWIVAKKGRHLTRVVTIPDAISPELARDAGWLAGMYDAEGTGKRIAQSLTHNPEIHARIGEVARRIGLPVTPDENGWYLTGGRQSFVDFVSKCGPTKKGRWVDQNVLTGKFKTKDRIVLIERDGVEEVVGLTTETGNYVVWGLASKNCDAHKENIGPKEVWNMSGASNLVELNDRLRMNGAYLRRVKADVLTELPAKSWAGVPMAMSAAGEREYAKAEEDTIEWMYAQDSRLRSLTEEAEIEWSKVAHTRKGTPDEIETERQGFIVAFINSRKERSKAVAQLTQFEGLKHAAWLAKRDSVLAWIDGFLEGSDRKLIVFGHHVAMVNEIAERYNAPKIQGGMKQEEVEEGKRRFQEDANCRVISCNLQAGGVGHTLTAASDVAFVELPWTPALLDQAVDRAHRIGQTDAVTGWLLTAARADGLPTIDEIIVDLLTAKRVVVNAATDGKEEVDEISIVDALAGRLLAGRK